MTTFRTINEYHDYVKNLVGRSGCSDDWSSIKFKAEDRHSGMVKADLLTLKDGSTLRFAEDLVIGSTGDMERPLYSYEYRYGTDNALYFRYDRDPKRAKPVVHEECHLHVNAENPRFKTHAASFEEVFAFIVACFCPEGH